MGDSEKVGTYSSKRVNGTKPKSFDLDDETFVCKPSMRGWTYLDYSARVASADASDQVRAILEFFTEVMETEEFDRFYEFVNSPDRLVEAAQLIKICTDLIGAYGGRRPTKPSAP